MFRIIPALLLLALTSCSTISLRDQQAYTNAISCKVDALALMDKATVSYETQTQAIEDTQKEISKAYEYDKHRKLNQITIKMWDKILDPNANLWGGFIKRWHDKSVLGARYIVLKKVQIGEGFDQVIELEQGKNTK